MTAVQREGARTSRATLRHKLFQPSEMAGREGTSRVHLLNLSTGGALVHLANAPRPGDAIHLRLGGEMLSARVAWARQSRFGVTFSIPLTDARVESVLSEQRALVAAASHRIGSLSH